MSELEKAIEQLKNEGYTSQQIRNAVESTFKLKVNENDLFEVIQFDITKEDWEDVEGEIVATDVTYKEALRIVDEASIHYMRTIITKQ